MKIAGSNVQLSQSFGGRNSVAMPQVKASGAKAHVYMGAIPKRSRGGTNPLASMPQALIQALNSLKAPSPVFQTADGVEVTPVWTENTEQALDIRLRDGEVQFWYKSGEGEGEWVRVDDSEILFQTEDGDQYTAEGVQVGYKVDRLAEPVQGTPDELNKLYNALGKYNKATGKQLRMILDHNILGDDGISIKYQVKNIERLA